MMTNSSCKVFWEQHLVEIKPSTEKSWLYYEAMNYPVFFLNVTHFPFISSVHPLNFSTHSLAAGITTQSHDQRRVYTQCIVVVGEEGCSQWRSFVTGLQCTHTSWCYSSIGLQPHYCGCTCTDLHDRQLNVWGFPSIASNLHLHFTHAYKTCGFFSKLVKCGLNGPELIRSSWWSGSGNPIIKANELIPSSGGSFCRLTL